MKTLINNILIMLFLTVGASQSFAEQKITFYHYDLLGSPVATTDENGAVTWREEYSPWGEKLLKEDDAHDNVRGYTGHVNDKETGLTYMQARYYDPQIGRFMGVDPVGFQENNSISFNRYGYANNNPYGFTDPNGESPAGDGLRGDDAEHQEMIGNMKDQEITDPSQSGAIDFGISLIPGMGAIGAYSDYNKGNYGMAMLGIASEIPMGKGLKLSKGLPDSTIACRGGSCTSDRFVQGSGVTESSAGLLSGVSVNSAADKSLKELAHGIPHSKVGVTTVGDIRKAGGNVVAAPTKNNPNHATLSGITAKKAESLMTPTVRNPNR